SASSRWSSFWPSSSAATSTSGTGGPSLGPERPRRRGFRGPSEPGGGGGGVELPGPDLRRDLQPGAALGDLADAVRPPVLRARGDGRARSPPRHVALRRRGLPGDAAPERPDDRRRHGDREDGADRPPALGPDARAQVVDRDGRVRDLRRALPHLRRDARGRPDHSGRRLRAGLPAAAGGSPVGTPSPAAEDRSDVDHERRRGRGALVSDPTDDPVPPADPGPHAPPAEPKPKPAEPPAEKPPWERDPVAPVWHDAFEGDAPDVLAMALKEALPEAILGARRSGGEPGSDLVLDVAREAIAEVARLLKETHGFALIVDICGADYRDRAPRFDVIYHLGRLD